MLLSSGTNSSLPGPDLLAGQVPGRHPGLLPHLLGQDHEQLGGCCDEGLMLGLQRDQYLGGIVVLIFDTVALTQYTFTHISLSITFFLKNRKWFNSAVHASSVRVLSAGTRSLEQVVFDFLAPISNVRNFLKIKLLCYREKMPNFFGFLCAFICLYSIHI